MQKFIAFAVAASVFCGFSVVVIRAIALQSLGYTLPWIILIPSCIGASFIGLVIFGEKITDVGHNILDMIGIEFEYPNINEGFAYVLGNITILTFAVLLALARVYLRSTEPAIPLSTYGITYGLMVLCFIMAGISFAAFYPNTEETA